MLVVRVLDGYVRIVGSGKRVGQHSVRNVVLFSRIGRNKNSSLNLSIIEVKFNAKRSTLGTDVP